MKVCHFGPEEEEGTRKSNKMQNFLLSSNKTEGMSIEM